MWKELTRPVTRFHVDGFSWSLSNLHPIGAQSSRPFVQRRIIKLITTFVVIGLLRLTDDRSRFIRRTLLLTHRGTLTYLVHGSVVGNRKRIMTETFAPSVAMHLFRVDNTFALTWTRLLWRLQQFLFSCVALCLSYILTIVMHKSCTAFLARAVLRLVLRKFRIFLYLNSAK